MHSCTLLRMQQKEHTHTYTKEGRLSGVLLFFVLMGFFFLGFFLVKSVSSS